VTATNLDSQFAPFEAAERGAGLARRQAALQRFKAEGFPTRRQELYKYTDLKPIAEGEFDLVPAVPTAAGTAAVAERIESAALDLGGARLVFVDGHFSDELSHGAGELPLERSALAEHWERTETPAADDAHALATLNTAFMHRGTYLRVPEGVKLDAPLHVVYASSTADGLAPQPRLRIDVGANAELTVVQHFLDAGDPSAWTNVVTEVRQAAGSELILHRLQEHGSAHCHTSLLDVDLGRDARFASSYVDLGGRLVRNDIAVKLAAPGAETNLCGLLLARSGQHIDDHVRVDHAAAHTRSLQNFRGIAGAKGRGVFNGKVVVHPGAQKVDARQRSDNLLLARNAEIDAKPELEIYADDVKCAHGATVGELDAEQLFYLRARGVDADAARALLTFAFANSVLERIALAPLREHYTRRVAACLPSRGAWEGLA
jgi:Fe-S cluster assembly protein SufD